MYTEYANVIASLPTSPLKKAVYFGVYSGRRYNVKYPSKEVVN
jgi:hypothetical protein